MEDLVYYDLLEQESKLSEDERKAFLIYKSSLFKLINIVSSIEGFMDMDNSYIVSIISDSTIFNECSKFGKEVEKIENLALKYTLFADFDFDNPIFLVEEVKKIYNTLYRSSNKIKTKDKIKLYRMINIVKDSKEDMIARGNIISTSIDKEAAYSFMSKDPNRKNILYEIELDSNVGVLVSSLSIINEYDSEFDKLINNTKRICIRKTTSIGQKEVLLFKDNLDFEVLDTHFENINNCLCEVVRVKAFNKKNKLTRKS